MNSSDEDIQIARKKTIRKLLLVFLCVMAFLTFFSNTINNFTLPRVKTQYVAGGSLVKEVTGEGSVVARESQCEYTQLTALVEAVNVEAGDKVAKGQVIMTLERQAAEQKLREASILLEKQKLTLQRLTDEAVKYADEAGDLEIMAAKQKLEEKETNYNNTKALYDAGAESLSGLKTAEYDLKDAEIAYRKVLGEYRDEGKSNGRELLEAKYDLELKQLEVDRLSYELENFYTLRAKCNGIVKEVNFEKSTLTNSAKPLFIIINAEKGYEFKISVDTDIAKYLALGDTMDVRIKTLGSEALKGTIGRIEDSESEKGKKKELYIDIEEEGLTGGETGEIYQNKDIGFYDLLVSNNAVHTETEGKFVWLIREKQKPLGSEFYLVKAYVTVGESDNSKTAVLSGLAVHDRVVIGIEENKPVSEGSKVIINN